MANVLLFFISLLISDILIPFPDTIAAPALSPALYEVPGACLRACLFSLAYLDRYFNCSTAALSRTFPCTFYGDPASVLIRGSVLSRYFPARYRFSLLRYPRSAPGSHLSVRLLLQQHPQNPHPDLPQLLKILLMT